MNYNFDEIINRRGTGCYKWDIDEAQGALPMWVADMDFRVAQPIIDALHRRVEHGIFGYTLVGDRYYEAVVNWFRRRHGWTIRREWIQYTIGVVPALSVIIKALTSEGDAVLVQTPVYNCFFSCIRNNGCRVVAMPLTWHTDAENYTVDYGLMEQTIVDNDVKLFLLCNPHNPTCRVWTQVELATMADICHRHNVIVVSDEIHCEFVNPSLGYGFTPFATVAEPRQMSYIVANAPSKAFNIAGLQMAYIISPSDDFRQLIDRAINVNEVCDVNPFGIIALEAAYSADGEQWLNQLVNYIQGNYQLFRSMLKTSFPDMPVAWLDGTYLAWMDVSAFPLSSERIAADLRYRNKVWINPGEMYGQTGFLRVNLACPRTQVEAATRRIICGLSSLWAHPTNPVGRQYRR